MYILQGFVILYIFHWQVNYKLLYVIVHAVARPWGISLSLAVTSYASSLVILYFFHWQVNYLTVYAVARPWGILLSLAVTSCFLSDSSSSSGMGSNLGFFTVRMTGCRGGIQSGTTLPWIRHRPYSSARCFSYTTYCNTAKVYCKTSKFTV